MNLSLSFASITLGSYCSSTFITRLYFKMSPGCYSASESMTASDSSPPLCWTFHCRNHYSTKTRICWECLWGLWSCPAQGIAWLSYGLPLGSHFYVLSLTTEHHSLGCTELALLHCFFPSFPMLFFWHPFTSLVHFRSLSSISLCSNRLLWKCILQLKQLEFLLDLTAELMVHLGVT